MKPETAIQLNRLHEIIYKQLEIVEQLQGIAHKAIQDRSSVPFLNESLFESAKILAQLTEARRNLEAIE